MIIISIDFFWRFGFAICILDMSRFCILHSYMKFADSFVWEPRVEREPLLHLLSFAMAKMVAAQEPNLSSNF